MGLTQRRLPVEPGESAQPFPVANRFCPRCGTTTIWFDWLDPGSGQISCANIRDDEDDERCGFDARSELTEAEVDRISALEPPSSYRSYTWT